MIKDEAIDRLVKMMYKEQDERNKEALRVAIKKMRGLE